MRAFVLTGKHSKRKVYKYFWTKKWKKKPDFLREIIHWLMSGLLRSVSSSPVFKQSFPFIYAYSWKIVTSQKWGELFKLLNLFKISYFFVVPLLLFFYLWSLKLLDFKLISKYFQKLEFGRCRLLASARIRRFLPRRSLFLRKFWYVFGFGFVPLLQWEMLIVEMLWAEAVQSRSSLCKTDSLKSDLFGAWRFISFCYVVLPIRVEILWIFCRDFGDERPYTQLHGQTRWGNGGGEARAYFWH